jgi:hypothetical protein
MELNIIMDRNIKEKPKQLGEFLYQINPNTLVVTESDYKDISNYQGGGLKPISVVFINGEYQILDGHHRTKFAIKEGRDIKAVVIPESDYLDMKQRGVHQADMFSEFAYIHGERKAAMEKQASIKESITESPTTNKRSIKMKIG